MDCRTAREALLTAEIDDLAATRQGLLADHLRTCPACARDAERILAATTRLAMSLTPHPSAKEPTSLPGNRARTLRRFAIPALAAAAVLLVVTRPAPAPRTPPSPTGRAAVPAVEVPEGRNAVVFRTSDPTITVVWYF